MIFFVVIISFGCDKERPEKTSKVVMVLFDLSETTNKPEIRKNYTESFKLVLQSIREGDAIIAGLITENSFAQQKLPINFELPDFDYNTDNTLLLRKYKNITDSIINLKIDSLWLIVDSLLTWQGYKVLKTDILGAIGFSYNVIKKYNQPRKILVILSDMREDSRNYNFDNEVLDEKRIKAIIEQEKKRKNLPDLSGLKIYIAGANATNQTKYNEIKNFWIEYFKETGASLEPHRYGSLLLKFEE